MQVFLVALPLSSAQSRMCYEGCACRDAIRNVKCENDEQLRHLHENERNYDLHIGHVSSYERLAVLEAFFDDVVYSTIGQSQPSAYTHLEVVKDKVINNLAGVLSLFIITTILSLIYILKQKITMCARDVTRRVLGNAERCQLATNDTETATEAPPTGVFPREQERQAEETVRSLAWRKLDCERGEPGRIFTLKPKGQSSMV